VLLSFDDNDSAWKPRLSAFTQALADLGWSDGRKRPNGAFRLVTAFDPKLGETSRFRP
jgi:hypothetical protein